MSRGIRKTGIFIAVMLTVVVLTGCQIAKKDESGQAKEELYGAYAVVGDRIPDRVSCHTDCICISILVKHED